MKFGTKAIHAGVHPDKTTGAIMTPIYQTSTYVQEAPVVNKGYGYARGKNPTREALQDNLAALENGKHCVCFSSGVAAKDAVLSKQILNLCTSIKTMIIIDEIGLEKISEDSLHSTFLITIPEKVPLHFHKQHTENIVVLGGKALMKLGSDTLIISKGDQLTIPKGTPHEVIKVISRKPLRVYSIQSPLFDGSDRYFVKP
jgi:mannose-6-phosphate isomerase-like protein (cupin superfamily)